MLRKSRRCAILWSKFFKANQPWSSSNHLSSYAATSTANLRTWCGFLHDSDSHQQRTISSLEVKIIHFKDQNNNFPCFFRLRWQRATKYWDCRVAAGLQSAIPEQHLPTARQSRVQQHQPPLRIPGRATTTLSRRWSIPVHGLQSCLLLAAILCPRRRQNSLWVYFYFTI